MAETELLEDQLQRLRLQLPKLSFDPETDLLSADLPDAIAYLDHYNLAPLTERTDTQHFIGAIKCNGYTIACQYWLPAAPTGTAFVVHGYFDHAGLFGHLFQYLLDKNLAIVAFDLPGHGLSSGEQASIVSFDHYVDVFEAILGAAKNNLPKPWHVIGQSTGGAIVLKHLLEASTHCDIFRRIALLAPLLHPRDWRRNRLVYLIAHRFLSRLKRKFLNNSGDNAFLTFLNSQDPMQARHLPLEWIGAMKRWTEEYHDLPKSDVPLSIIQGDRDATLDWRYNLKEFRDKLPEANIHIIKGANHHLVNETEAIRTQVFEAMGFNHD